MGLGAAVLGAAAIGGVSSLAGGIMQSGAAQTAAGEQAQSASNALALQKQMFGTAQSALSPYYTAGQSVLPTLQSLLTPGKSQTQTLSQLPGFQFQSQWGNLSATNALAAQGLGGSAGPLAQAISSYNNGLAGTSFSNLVSQLEGFAGTGANAAGALGGDAIYSGNSQASSALSEGNALAAGALGSTNALAGGLTGAGSSVSSALLLSTLAGGGSSGGIYGGLSGLAAPTGSAFNPYSVDM